MLSTYQLKIADHHNIPTGNVKKLVPNFFDKEKCLIYYENLQLYSTLLKTRIEPKKNTSRIRIQSISMAKTKCWIQHKKRIKAEKNGEKDRKALYKLMNNAVYGKIMENLRNRTNIKLVSNKKDYLKWKSKQSYMSHKIFDINT